MIHRQRIAAVLAVLGWLVAGAASAPAEEHVLTAHRDELLFQHVVDEYQARPVTFAALAKQFLLCEWTLGNGKVLAYGNQIDLSPDSPHRANAIRFVHNVIRHLTAGKESPAVAVVAPFGTLKHRFAEAEPVPHSLLTDDPGKVCLDLWGWYTTTRYQRLNQRIVTPDYIKKRAIDESYKWGANLVELCYYGGYHCDGYHLQPRAGWTKEGTAALHRHIHSRDMVVQWVTHLGIELRRGNKEFTIAIDALRSLGREQLDSLHTPAGELLDGIGSEQWSTIWPLLFNKCMWPYSPFMYSYTDNHMFDETLPNEMDVSASNGFGTDDQTSGYHQLHAEIRKRYGLQFWGSQAECRSQNCSEEWWPKYAEFGGLGVPDWVLKQVNDQFRLRARVRGTRNVSPSAIWWINEADTVCPDENRPYVYGISQDPIKCAVTAKLTGLGKGGKVTFNGRQLPQRYPYPSQTAFIQNNYLRVLLLHDQDKAIVLHDLERLAHYDGNSCSVPVCDPFCQTLLLSNDKPGKATSIAFQHVEPAGYNAVLRARLRLDFGERQVEETRTFTAINDTPYVRVKIERTVTPGPVALGTRLGLPAYDRLVFGQSVHERSGSLPVADIVKFTDSSGTYPDLVLMILARGRLATMRWEPKKALTLQSQPTRNDSFEVALVVPGGLYDDEGLRHLHEFLAKPGERLALGPQGEAVVRNELPIPLVKVVRVMGGGAHPYQLYEFDRWTFRGAQPSLVHKGEDYLKCYLPPMGSVRIVRYGFLDDVAKPGWGCQYTVALRGCRRQGNRCSIAAEVKDITSFLFAPRVQFKNPVSGVLLNGNDWRYFNGQHVFLPNRRGQYQIEVVEGQAERPHLARTFAHIESASWQDGRLSFEARLPEWVQGIPEDFYFAALIRHRGQTLIGLENAELVRAAESTASIVRFKPGTVSLTFGKPVPGKSVRQIDPDAEIEDYLSRFSAKDLLRYTKPFNAELVSLRAGSATKSALACCDVFVWNHFFLDSLPAAATPAAIEALREYVQQGGGLFLMGNAVRLLPQLTGCNMDKVRTLHLGHKLPGTRQNLSRSIRHFGVEPVAEAHAIFRGLRAIQPEGRTYPLIVPGGFDILKRVVWQTPADANDKGTCLAKMHVEFKGDKSPQEPALESSPVLWEWRLGRGKIVAYACGLRFALGSPERWKPSDNSLAFVQNIVRYLANGKKEIRVGIIW